MVLEEESQESSYGRRENEWRRRKKVEREVSVCELRVKKKKRRKEEKKNKKKSSKTCAHSHDNFGLCEKFG